MTTQVATKKTSLRGVMATAAFRHGFEDFNKEKPFRDIDNMGGNRKKSATDTVWAYERGRLFGAYLKGKNIFADTLKQNGAVRWDLIDIMSDAVRERAIR